MENSRKTWTLWILPPIIFLLCLMGLITYFSMGNLSGEAIAEKTAASISLILFVSQLLILLLLLRYAKKHQINILLDTFKSPQIIKDIFWGILLGLLISISYFKLGLSEVIAYLQNNLGDYVPAGETSKSVSNNISLFFIANVLLAPFVEENIYRNIVFKELNKKYNDYITVLLTALFFGLLHWMGGFWYILATGIFIGIPFGIIQLKRDSILLVFVAHLVLNVIEFIFALGI